jgi:hypothetical protein
MILFSNDTIVESWFCNFWGATDTVGGTTSSAVRMYTPQPSFFKKVEPLLIDMDFIVHSLFNFILVATVNMFVSGTSL